MGSPHGINIQLPDDLYTAIEKLGAFHPILWHKNCFQGRKTFSNSSLAQADQDVRLAYLYAAHDKRPILCILLYPEVYSIVQSNSFALHTPRNPVSQLCDLLRPVQAVRYCCCKSQIAARGQKSKQMTSTHTKWIIGARNGILQTLNKHSSVLRGFQTLDT